MLLELIYCQTIVLKQLAISISSVGANSTTLFLQFFFFFSHFRGQPVIRLVLIIAHCVKNVQIQSYFWSVYSCIWTEYTEYSVSLRI